MARNNANYSKKPKSTDLIPLGVFSIVPIQDENGSDIFLNLAPFTNKQVKNTDVGITYNNLLDKIFIFENGKYLNENQLYYDNNWTVYGNINDIYSIRYRLPMLSVMVHPATVYKLNNIKFANNPSIRKVHDLYNFVFYDLEGLFKNCVYLTECDVDHFGPSIVIPNTKPNLDMMFANCINLFIGPSANKKSKWMDICNNNPDIKVSMNYALMNTPRLKNNTLLHSIRFVVDENGGKGIFLNSNINHAPLLDLSNVYELRNTFNASYRSGDRFPYSVDLSAAVIADAMFKDSGTFSSITINNANNLKYINSMFKDNHGVRSISLNFNDIHVYEANDLFSGCYDLTNLSNKIILDNCEYTPGIFKNCNDLTTFYDIHLENSKIVSSAYEGCLQLDKVSRLSNSDTMSLTNAYMLNNLFKNCKNLTFDIDIELHTNPNIFADGMFEGCESITTQPNLNDESIISTACMYKDCTNLSNTSVCDFIMSKDSSAMYNGCTSLTTHNMNEYNSPLITTSMFENCTVLTGGNYNLSNTTYCANMFKNCKNLTNAYANNNSQYSLDVSGMFEGCTRITGTPQVFNSKNAKLLTSTFKGCYNLTSLDLCLDNAINMDGIFYGCSSLSNLNIILNKSNLSRFPRIDLRGTSISLNNFLEISTKLPDMSKYVYYNNGNDIVQTINWSLINVLDIFETRDEYIAWKSQNFTLVPGKYKFSVYNDYEIAVSIIKVTDNGYEAVCPLIFINGMYYELTFDIEEEGSYFIYEYNKDYSGEMHITWIEPYYTIDIRNTPASRSNYVSLNNIITNLNNKGWHVLTNDDLVISDDGIETYSLRPEISNYLDGVNISNINNMYESEEFSLPAGFYNVCDENDIIDKIKIYKVAETGSYAIAMSYENEHMLNFELLDDSIVKIKYRYDSNGLKIKKM